MRWLNQPSSLFTPDGASFYVAAFGSDRVAHVDNNGNILARIEIGNASGSQSDPRNKRGPRGPGAERLDTTALCSQSHLEHDYHHGHVE